MIETYRLERERTALLVVDVQERLFTAMDLEQREAMVRNIKLLAAGARRLGLPVLVSEQYPKGLGHTLPELREALVGVQPLTKVEFSCGAVEGFPERLRALGVRSVVVAGIEAHVCVLMTALDLVALGHAVHVPADAVCSRTRASWATALDLLRGAGAVVTTTETILFQLLRRADTAEFRDLRALIK